ncbi:hypothetical protein VP01_4165g4 [Puccinia sorghi]|uniref:Reverse transcriptase Ty1/copia-type domain-containing protein n=1 Tax=Puccinia sorghi TaxID=27349 RepID=A0A0L6URT7_9BASI|nr:hypothetical protein VP01_4165g4 [Puccinia sorghi]
MRNSIGHVQHSRLIFANNINFQQSISDPCLFIHMDKYTHIFFHVDDLLVFPNSLAHDPDTLLGMDLINKGLDMLGMTDCKPVKTPLFVRVQLKNATPEEKEEFSRLKVNYQTYTGILNYLSCRTRPDLAPAEILHCWKYLQGSKHLELTLQPNIHKSSNSLQHFTDATWADDLETHLSQSRSICFWKECPVAWNSKKQRNITLSSTKAEMNALADGVQENH